MNLNLTSKYQDRRIMDYPELSEQLDMLWHGMNNNPEKRIEPFYSAIKKVKDSHPK